MFDGNLKKELVKIKKDNKSLLREKQLLVREIKSLKKEKLVAIKSPIVVPMDDRSFLLTASKTDMIFLPNGHKGFNIRKVEFLFEECSNYIKLANQNIRPIKFLTTEGAFAYLHTGEYWNNHDWVSDEWYKNKMLFEEVPQKETRIYEPLQRLIRHHNRAILKVTLQKPMTQVEAKKMLGMNIDPIVEIIFE